MLFHDKNRLANLIHGGITMKNHTRINKLLTVLLLLCVSFVCMAGTAKAAEDCAHVFADGKCSTCGVMGGYCGAEGDGTNLVWTLNDGTFAITGTGAMADYTSSTRPWADYCDSVTNLVIEDGVTAIGNFSFYECSNLTSVEMPDSVTSIGKSAFSKCAGLTSLDLPDSLTFIGNEAFYGCTGLTSLTIPASVTEMNNAFFGCSGLTDITISDGVTSIHGAFYRCTGLTSITIPNSVTSIGYAFYGCTGLESIVVPDSVTEMEHAFDGCTGLRSANIPSSVTSINGAFRGCTSLTSIEIPDSVTTIGNYAFTSCTSLTSIVIPDSVTTIGDSAFSLCTGLTSIDIPDSVTTIGNYAFGGCTGLTSIVIPDSVTTINDRVFSGCTGLESVAIPNSVTVIRSNAFEGCTQVSTVIISCTPTIAVDYCIDKNFRRAERIYVHAYENGVCTDCGATCDHNDIDDNGKCPVCGLQHVASVTVGSEVTYYKTLQEAMSAADKKTATVKLLTDCTLDTVTDLNDGSNVTLNLNSQTITASCELHIKVGATLNIKGPGNYTYNGETHAKVIDVYGTLNISGGTFSAANDCTNTELLWVEDAGKVNISGGSFTAKGQYATPVKTFGDVTVTGAPTFSASEDHREFSISDNGTLDLSGVTGSMDGWRVFNNDATYAVFVGQNLKLPDDGYVLKDGDEFVTTLTRGEIGTIVEHKEHDYVEAHDPTYHWTACACGAATEKVTHTFTYTPVTGKEVHIVGCSGCTYTAAEPHTFTQNDAGEWVCDCKAKAVASITSGSTVTKYMDFADALAAWTDGTTLTLLDNVTYDASVNPGAGTRTFDGDDYTLDLAGKCLLNEGTLTIQNAKITSNNASSCAVENDGKMMIKESTITNSEGTAISNRGSLTVENSVLNAWSACLSTDGDTAALTNCTLNCQEIEIEYAKGKLTIDGDCDGWEVRNTRDVLVAIGTDIFLPEGYYMFELTEPGTPERLVTSLNRFGTIRAHEHEYTYTDNHDGTHSYGCTCGLATAARHDFAENDAGEWVCACKAKAVAKVGDTFYASIHNALRAAEKIDGCTLTLLEDITLTSMSNTAAYTNTGTFTLELFGKTLSSNKGTLSVLGSADLTIKDSFGGGKIISTGSNAIYQTGGKVIIESGTFEGTLDGVFLSGNSTLSVKGGSFVGSRAMITGFGSDCVIDLTAIDPAGFTLKNNGSGTFAPRLPSGYAMVNGSGTVVESLSAEESATVKASLENATVTLSENNFAYDGQPHMPTVTVTLDGTNLTEGTDYQVLYMRARKMANGEPTQWFGDHTTSDPCVKADDGYYAVIVGMGNYYTADVFTLYKNFVIEPRLLTIKADDQTIPVGGSVDTANFTITEGALVEGHTMTAEVQVADGTLATPGTYTNVLYLDTDSVSIMAGEENVKSNYSITLDTGTLTIVEHIHEWTYTASDDTITATCNAEGCPDAEQSITISAVGKTYDGTPVTATLTGPIDGVATPEITYTGNTNADTHTASITIEGETASVEFTIEKATVTVTADAKSKPYGTDNPTLTYTSEGLLGDDVLTGALETTATKTSNVGEYDITVGSLANSNYTIDFVGAKLTITKADSSCTAPVAVSGLTFNGGNQSLITAGTATGGTMQYSLDNVTWSETIPTGKDAKTYTVYYKVVGDGNHNGTDPISLDVTITPKAVTELTFEGLNEVYAHTGEAIIPTFVVTDGETTLTEGTDYTADITNNTDVGTATITITLTGNYSGTVAKTFEIKTHVHEWNYNVSGDTITATCTSTIGPCSDAEQSITLSASDAVYNGNPVEAEVTPDGADLTYTLRYTGTDYDSPYAPVNAGDYTVTMTVGDKSVSASFTISPKNISVVQSIQFSLAQTSFVYSGEAPALNVTGVDSSVGNYTMQEGTDYTVGTVQVNAGSHELTVTGKGNYTGSVELDYSIAAKPITITDAVVENVTFDPAGYTLTVKEVVFDGVIEGETLVMGENGDYAAVAELTSENAASDAATANVTVSLMNANYSLSETTVEATFQITQSGTEMTATADKTSYTYGETITVTGTVKATGTAPATTLTLRSAPAAQQVALFAADGTQLTDPMNVVDGAYTLTYNTADKGILPAEAITLTVKFVGDDNMADQSASVTVALTAKSIEPVLSGSASKAYDGTTTVTDAGNLTINLTGIITGDSVSASAAGYVYADETVGQSKTVTANGITLSGADSTFYTLAQTEASAQIGEIKKAMLIGLTEPADTTLDVYCADADAVIGKLPDTVVYHLADGRKVDLKVEWSCTAYDSTPGAINAFAWAVSDSEKLACYEIAQNVADDGTVIVTNSAFLPVTVTGTDTAITYNGTAYDVTQMFAIDSNAGAAVFEIIGGGTGEGTLNGSVLTITKAGTINIKVTTAPNAAYAAGEAMATLTINKGTPAVTLPTGLTAWYGQKLSDIALPTVDGGAWSWTDMNSTVGNSGVQTHQAIFTPDDTNLWNITTHPVSITVAQAGTSFGEMKVYNGNAESTTFTYGETITVKAEATAVQPAVFSLRSLIAPAKHQMALFIRTADGSEVQISEAVNEQNGVYTMAYNTTGKALRIGDNALIAKFVGDENMADYQETVLVTLNPKELGIASLTARDRVYAPGNRQVAITGTEVSGKADANDDVSVLIDGMTATISSENVGTYDTALIPQNVSLTGNHAGYYFARGNVSVSIPQGVEITQATPYTASGAPAQPVFEPIYQDGMTLGDVPVSLADGTFYVPGNIEWEAPGDTPVTEGTPFTWVFTPDDPNWKPVTGTVVIYPDGEPPVITAPAGDQEVTVYEGEQGTMFITAADASSYQWYINRYDGLGYVPISGATSASYTTSVVNLGNDGFTYYCVASNAYGNAESPVFLLQVLEKIEVPETGDESNIALWTALAILSFAGLTIITMNGRRSKITR